MATKLAKRHWQLKKKSTSLLFSDWSKSTKITANTETGMLSRRTHHHVYLKNQIPAGAEILTSTGSLPSPDGVNYPPNQPTNTTVSGELSIPPWP